MSEIIDNRAHRIRTLKEIILKLHRGVSPNEVKAEMKALVQSCDAAEIAAMEQQLMDEEGINPKEVMGMCDLHSAVVREILVDREEAALEPGHPVDTFRRENQALLAAAESFEKALQCLTAAADPEAPTHPDPLSECRHRFNDLMDVETHYRRKENLLFPMLERHGVSGPSKVMWGKDDEVRALLKQLGQALGREDATVHEWRAARDTVAMAALGALREMVSKEENILWPMALQILTEAEWGEIHEQSPQFGWCLVEAGDVYRPPTATPPAGGAAAEERDAGTLVFPSGALTLEQLTAMFSTLPVDLTFVDVEDRVRFFSEGPDRVFDRPKAIVGRKVQHCHPPSSLGVVERILSDFRTGKQSVAEFWIDLAGRFVHIRYFAIRSAEGRYIGTLEVTQDVTGIRGLEGERRLLQYG